jgi:hypothetical protein
LYKHIPQDEGLYSLSEHLLPLGFETSYEVDEKAEGCDGRGSGVARIETETDDTFPNERGTEVDEV